MLVATKGTYMHDMSYFPLQRPRLRAYKDDLEAELNRATWKNLTLHKKLAQQIPPTQGFGFVINCLPHPTPCFPCLSLAKQTEASYKSLWGFQRMKIARIHCFMSTSCQAFWHFHHETSPCVCVCVLEVRRSHVLLCCNLAAVLRTWCSSCLRSFDGHVWLDC